MTYRVVNHNNTLLGEFVTRTHAEAEAQTYRGQTGNAAYVEEEEPPQRDCPLCDAPLERRHHAATLALPECWWWSCPDCPYQEAPE